MLALSPVTPERRGTYYAQVNHDLDRTPVESGRVQVLGERPLVLRNPYATVDWPSVNQYLANMHCHTIYSDGFGEPEETIYAYAEAGYHILAITEHDCTYRVREGERDPGHTNEPTWSWTDYIDEVPSRIWTHNGKETSAFYPDLGKIGMLAVVGNEPTTEPHMVSLFNHCGWWVYGGQTQDERLSCIEANNGISYWAHASDYVPGGRRVERIHEDPTWEKAVEFYGYYISKYDSCLGIELQLGNHLERDLELMDRLLQKYYKDHNIFIKGSDDNHRSTVSRRATLTIVLAKDLTEEAVRHALEHGHTFVGSRTDTYPVFNGITVDEEQKTIILDIENHKQVRWIKNGKKYTTGDRIDFSAMRDAVLRFEVDIGDVVFYSQGFYIW